MGTQRQRQEEIADGSLCGFTRQVELQHHLLLHLLLAPAADVALAGITFGKTARERRCSSNEFERTEAKETRFPSHLCQMLKIIGCSWLLLSVNLWQYLAVSVCCLLSIPFDLCVITIMLQPKLRHIITYTIPVYCA